MQSFFYYLLKDSTVYSRLVAEIDQAQADGQLSDHVTWVQAQNLSYFQACLKEAMRLRPAVGLNISRCVPPEGAVIDGIYLEGGTRVALNAWVLHRDKDVFGENPELFNPERWLQVDEPTLKLRNRHMYQ